MCEFSLGMDKCGICKIMHEIGEMVENMFSVIRQDFQTTWFGNPNLKPKQPIHPPRRLEKGCMPKF